MNTLEFSVSICYVFSSEVMLFDKCDTIGLLSEALKLGGAHKIKINGVERNFNFNKPGGLSNLKKPNSCRGVDEKLLTSSSLQV
jgi:hypothetical protein